MNTTWFDATVAWIPGTLLGVAGGAFGGLAGLALASAEKRRRWRARLVASYWSLVSYSAVLLVLAIVALLLRQPRGVWYALLLPGLLGTGLFAPLCLHVVRADSPADERPNHAPEPISPLRDG